MTNCTLILALLCTLGWISASVCQLYIVVVLPRGEVTLQCSNSSNVLYRVFWFKLTNGQNVSLISSMLSSESNASFYGGFQHGKFTMTSNMSSVFLNIKELDVNDSGIYFCGSYHMGVPGVFTATHLQIEDQFNGTNNLLNRILGGIIIFLVIFIMSLVVKIRTLHKGLQKDTNLHENLDSHTLDYTAISFHPKTKDNKRPSTEKQMEQNVLYSAAK